MAIYSNTTITIDQNANTVLYETDGRISIFLFHGHDNNILSLHHRIFARWYTIQYTILHCTKVCVLPTLGYVLIGERSWFFARKRRKTVYIYCVQLLYVYIYNKYIDRSGPTTGTELIDDYHTDPVGSINYGSSFQHFALSSNKRISSGKASETICHYGTCALHHHLPLNISVSLCLCLQPISVPVSPSASVSPLLPVFPSLPGILSLSLFLPVSVHQSIRSSPSRASLRLYEITDYACIECSIYKIVWFCARCGFFFSSCFVRLTTCTERTDIRNANLAIKLNQEIFSNESDSMLLVLVSRGGNPKEHTKSSSSNTYNTIVRTTVRPI